MATEISLDLINQLKVSLRKEANLSSFDPVGDYSDSSTIPSLPTAAEAIAELDASAPYLRCRNCKGKLLRGIESLICVFCGNQQRTSDNPPDPIKFTSTSGFKWFLSSLNLDGSEMVEPIKETNGSSRGAKAPVVKGIAVSKFLDLEIQWSAIEEKSINNGAGSMQNKNPLNLGGLNLDDYLVEGRGDFPQVDPAESKPKPVEDDFKDPRSLSLFDSVKSQGVVESKQNESFGLFKGNDGQKNVSSDEHENLSLFAGRDPLAEQGNFGFFEEKDAQDENLSLFEGKDAQRTSSSKDDESFGFFEGKDVQRNSYTKEDEDFGLFEGVKSFDDKVVASSSDWNSDFQSVSQEKVSGHPFVSSPADLSAHMDSVFGSGKDLLNEKPADSSAAYVSKGGDWLQDDLFGNVTGKTQSNVDDKNEGQVVGGNESSSMDIDWIGDDLWQTSEKKPIEKTPIDDNDDDDDDDDDDWNDFASSANSKTPSNLKNDVKEDEKQKTGTSVISDIAKGEEDDLFGTWDNFTSSVQPPGNNVSSSAEKNPEMNLFGGNNNHRDLDSDLFSESIRGQTSSEEVKALERTSDPDGKDQTLNLDNKNPLNLGGLNLDDYFVEGRGDFPKGDPAESKPKPVEDDFKDPRSLSLFDSVKSQGVVESQQNESFGLFKEKESQKNVSSQEHENLSLFAGRGSLAERGNFGFFEEKDAQDGNLSLFEGKDAQRTSSSRNVESFGFFDGKDAQRNSNSKDNESFGLFYGKDAQKDSASKEDEDFGLFEGVKSFDDKVVASSSDWDSDFQSVSHEKVSGDPFVSSPVDLSAHMDSVFGSGKDLLYEKPAAYVSNGGDWLQDDLFGNVTGKTQSNVHDKNEVQVVGGNESSSMDIDWIGDDLWQTSEKKPIEKTPIDDNDDDDDDWNDFASSANSKPPNNPLDNDDDDDDYWNAYASSANSKTPNNPLVKEDEMQKTGTSIKSDIAKGEEDDLFGTWDSFTSSVQPSTNNVNSFTEKNPEMNLFGANNNHRDLNSDLFSESLEAKPAQRKSKP